MTTSSSSTRSFHSPILFRDNGYRADKIETDAEKSLQTTKKVLETNLQDYMNDCIVGFKRDKEYAGPDRALATLDEEALTLTVTDHTDRDGSDWPLTFSIDELLNPANSTEETQNLPKQILQKYLIDNTAVKTQLQEWKAQAEAQKQDSTNQKIRHTWQAALTHLKALHPNPSSSGVSENLDESSVKINLSKRYISYKVIDENGEAQTRVISLIKDKTLAKTLEIDSTIQEIETNRKIQVSNPARYCGLATNIVKKGFVKDVHFIDEIQTKKTSHIQNLLKNIDAKISELKSDAQGNANKIESLKKFKKALQRKSKNNPNGVDYVAVELAIKHSTNKSLNFQKVQEEIKKQTETFEKDHKRDIDTYIREITLLGMSHEDAIATIEKNRSWHMLAPAESKESLLVRAMIHGVESIAETSDPGQPSTKTYEQFKELFDVKMTDEIKVLLKLDVAETPLDDHEGDLLIGGSLPETQTSATPQNDPSVIPNVDPQGSRSAAIPVNTNQNSNPEVRFGARAQVSQTSSPQPKPQNLDEWAEHAKKAVESSPKALLRSENEDQELKESIIKFIDTLTHNTRDADLEMNMSILEVLADKLTTNEDREDAVKILEKALNFIHNNSGEMINGLKGFLENFKNLTDPLEYLNVIKGYCERLPIFLAQDARLNALARKAGLNS